MKPILYFILLLSAILYFPQNATAGFFIKPQPAITAGNAAAVSAHVTTPAIMKPQPAKLLQVYRSYNQKEWYGIAAVFAGVLGLFIPGMNFLAILFGLLGIGRRCKAQGLAVAGFIIGMLELGLLLLTSSTLLSLILF